MATRSQQAHSEGQRTHHEQGKAVKRKAAQKVHETPHEPARAGRKATYAQEEHGTARPSRKSTRASANRAKPDANLNLREERAKTAPTNRFRKAHAKRVRARANAD